MLEFHLQTIPWELNVSSYGKGQISFVPHGARLPRGVGRSEGASMYISMLLISKVSAQSLAASFKIPEALTIFSK